MDMCANLLSCLRRPEDSKDRNSRPRLRLGFAHILWQFRVECCGICLVVVDTVQPDAKEFHKCSVDGKRKGQWLLDGMMI